jgi:hypothetical protein
MCPQDDANKPGYPVKKPGSSRLFDVWPLLFSLLLLQPVHPERV